MSATTFHLVAYRKHRNPDVGDLLARLNPELVLPNVGEDVRLPSPAELVQFSTEIGGETLPQTDDVAAVFDAYFKARE